MDERWTVSVDREACLGSGVCAATAAKHFRLHEGKSQPIDETITPEDIVLDAANLCPAEAITVSDAAGTPLAPS